jgi:hypothetical protein
MASKCCLLITPITLLLLIPTVGAIAVYGYGMVQAWVGQFVTSITLP